jgi:hypothetical protein
MELKKRRKYGFDVSLYVTFLAASNPGKHPEGAPIVATSDNFTDQKYC